MSNGMNVTIIFTEASGFENTTLNNVTEVTYPLAIIKEMECVPDSILHEDF